MKSNRNSSGVCPAKSDKNISGLCPVTGKNHGAEEQGSTGNAGGKSSDPRLVPAKCPFGYDSGTFKLGPLSCMICQALLHECSRCKPCSHKFCKACVSRFKDCPLCGADIEGEAEVLCGKNKVIYEDVSMERGAFLVQQAMRAFRAQNIGSAKSRLSILELFCCRTLGDSPSAITYYEESAEFLSNLPTKDLELVHTLSVSLNKIGDIRYYDGDLQSARSYYARSLDVRRNAVKEHSTVASQVIDLATSLAKVADVDKNLGNESTAVKGFEEAIECLEKLKLGSEQASLEQRRLSVLDFLHNQLADK
ncbi:unnamed protein product [Urochloa decumbens]|uniref:RING-type domain-containing protein n=1 Tax=Urochloa decumbens TaxID=240449 RepID=A0ABC9AXM2_9POAL